MPTLQQISNNGLTLNLPIRPINAGVNAPGLLANNLGRFGENYDLSTGSNLFKLLLALCGEAGTGSLKKNLLYPKLQQGLNSTHFTDLDRLYGSPLGLPRLPEEMYTQDPRNQALTQDQWDVIISADAQYRSRCLMWMRAIIAGSSPAGIALAGEAALGVRCSVLERYQYLENLNSDQPVSMQNIGRTNSPNEFIVIPEVLTTTQAEQRAAAQLLDRLRPMNSIPSVLPGAPTTSTISITGVVASSESFYVQRFVTGNSNINWPAVNLDEGLWITTTQREAPTFAFMGGQESLTVIKVVNVETSSEHIGDFNSNEKQLFGVLNQSIPPFFTFSAANSYSGGYTPIQMNVPWTASS